MVGQGRRGRPRKRCRLGWNYSGYICLGEGEVCIHPYELEAMRLVDYLGLKQETAALEMGVSRATVSRLLASGRRKLVDAVINRKSIRIC